MVLYEGVTLAGAGRRWRVASKTRVTT